MDEKNNNTPELREQERRRAINELREYREELLKQIQQSQIEENGTNGKNNTKKLGAHPGTGNFYSSHPTKEDDDSWIMNGGFINQFLMIIIAFCFAFTLYVVASFILI